MQNKRYTKGNVDVDSLSLSIILVTMGKTQIFEQWKVQIKVCFYINSG